MEILKSWAKKASEGEIFKVVLKEIQVLHRSYEPPFYVKLDFPTFFLPPATEVLWAILSEPPTYEPRFYEKLDFPKILSAPLHKQSIVSNTVWTSHLQTSILRKTLFSESIFGPR